MVWPSKVRIHIFDSRKILLHTGSSNYRPPTDRGKSAPKLKVIEEVIQEEEEEEEEQDHLVAPLHRSSSSPLCVQRRLSRSPPLTTAETSLASSIASADVGQLIDVAAEDQEMLPSFEPLNQEDRLKQPPTAAINEQLILARFDEDEDVEDESSDSEDEDDEDVIRNYLPNAVIVHANEAVNDLGGTKGLLEVKDAEIDSAASVSPDSNQFSTRSSDRKSSSFRNRKSGAGDLDSIGGADDADAEEEEAISGSLGAMRLSDQDAISDESGYSEESSSNNNNKVSRRGDLHSGSTTIVTLNNEVAVSSCDKKLGSDHENEEEQEQEREDVRVQVIEGDDDDHLSSRQSPQCIPPVPLPRTTISPQKETEDEEKETDGDHLPETAAVSDVASVADRNNCDLTVHSALISDFSSTEKLRYIHRTNGQKKTTPVAANPDFLQNRITEFCINI